MKLGFLVLEDMVSLYMPRRTANPTQVKRWLAFLRNRKDVITAMDFFTMPTVSLRMLYMLFVIERGQRRCRSFQRYIQSHIGLGNPAAVPCVPVRQRAKATYIRSGHYLQSHRGAIPEGYGHQALPNDLSLSVDRMNNNSAQFLLQGSSLKVGIFGHLHLMEMNIV